MLTIIHGSNILASRRFLSDLKAKFNGEIDCVDGHGLSDTVLLGKLNRNSLFSSKKLFVVENLPKEGVLKSLSSLPEEVDVVIWADKKIEVRLPKAKILEFKEISEENTFKFAGAVGFKNKKLALKILNKILIEDCPPELIVGILHRELRLLFAAKDGSLSQSAIHPYVVKKTLQKAPTWEKEELKDAMKGLLKIDLGIKTSSINFSSSLMTWICQTI